MRLINTETGQFVDKDPNSASTIYAILSHTWDKEGEQTYEQLKKIQQHYAPEAQAPRSRPGGPNAEAGTSSSPKQPESGPPPEQSLPSQIPNDLPSATTGTPHMPSSKPTKSWFTRRMARLKRLFPSRSARNAPQISSDSPSVTACPPTSLGRLTGSEVDGLVCTVSEAYGLATSTPAPTSGNSSAPSDEHQSDPPSKSIWDDPKLSPKIRDACAVARKNGYRYIWIDSCCIDKSSSSELSEAINSMYQWYRLSDVCYSYLADVPPGDDHQAPESSFRKSRWFTRGWTLQELIAPLNMEFLSRDWAPIGLKHALVDLIESITRINRRALLHLEPLSSFGIAQRLSWAAFRETTRVEDQAYSLLGIFDINMPTLYGEGDRAFQRLQEQIMYRIPDQSLFTWGRVYLPDSHLLDDNITTHNSTILQAYAHRSDRTPSAQSSNDFKDSGIHHVQLLAPLYHNIGYTSTPYGICTQFQMIPLTCDLLAHILSPSKVELELKLPDDSDRWYLAILGCEHTEQPGHLLGHVCYIPPSNSDVEFMYGVYIIILNSHTGSEGLLATLYPLSPETIEHFLPHLKLKMVYLPHPHPTNPLPNIQRRSYKMIRLILLRELQDALRSRGYHADLRDPDPDHPITHWLTLSINKHMIIIEFNYTLGHEGNQVTINAIAKVKMSGSSVQLDSVSNFNQADHHTIFWSTTPYSRWETRFGLETVILSAEGAETLAVDFSLDFAGMGVYFMCIDVWSTPASSAVELAGGTSVELARVCRDRTTVRGPETDGTCQEK